MTTGRLGRWSAIVLLGGLATAAPRPAGAQPSTHLDDYVLFADVELRTKGLRLAGGDVGVNQGSLFSGGTLDVPGSTVAAGSVRIGSRSRCAALFANAVGRTGVACAPGVAFAVPIVPDVAAACGFPAPFPSCDPDADVTVGRDQTVTLPPGIYGDVLVRGGAGKPGRLEFTGGDYALCRLDAARDAELVFLAPAEVSVEGQIEAGNTTFTGPAPGSGVGPLDVRLFSDGARVHFSRRSRVAARLCAPGATLFLTEGASIEGSFVARVIRTERIGGGATTTTTTTTSAPTTTTFTTTTTQQVPSTTSSTQSTTTTTHRKHTTTTTLTDC
jgi:hypothetical protein